MQGWFSWCCTSRCALGYDKAVIAGDSAPHAVFSSYLQARDARHHGWYGPESLATTPLYLAVTVRCWSCLRFKGLWIFLEDDFWYSVFSSPWFDSGYTLGVSLWSFLEECHTILRVRHNAHHLRVVSAIRAWFWYVYGFGRPGLEREVQWDVRVHSSSCGAHLGVVHSPFGRLYHRCHCICRDHVLYVGRLP